MAKKIATHVFYSWQSDSPRKTNLNAIRKALANACKRLEAANSELKLVPDEATRDTSGSPNIALKILEKIERSSIFIADITTITSSNAQRPCPNPNVSYELGYAVATLGWERIILLFNDAIGQFPSDLPFDFMQNRANPYHWSLGDPPSKREELSAFLETAVKAVLDKNPKRPAELRGLTPEKIEHDHDVKNMRWLMRSLHIPTLQDHIEQLPYTISDKSLWFYDHFRSICTSKLFSVYDTVLLESVNKLCESWMKALAHDNQYHETSSGRLYVFSNPGDMPLSTRQQKAWDEIDASRRDMAEGLQTLLERLRAAYLEINIRKTSNRAWKDYIDFLRDLEGNRDVTSKDKIINRQTKKIRRKHKPEKEGVFTVER